MVGDFFFILCNLQVFIIVYYSNKRIKLVKMIFFMTLLLSLHA